MAERYPDFDERRTQWYRIVDSDVLNIIRTEGSDAAREFISELIGLDDMTEKTR